MTVQRGCGFRLVGSAYLVTDMSPNGQPVESFLVDPPHRMAPEEVGASEVGVSLIEKDGITHVVDWVGSRHYPNVADFVEEVRRYGLSRRVPKNLDFSRLTKRSRLILMHRRAWISDHERYFALEPMKPCPSGKGSEHGTKEMCARLWWEDVDPIKQDVSINPKTRAFERQNPSFKYLARVRPEEAEGKWESGIFASFPIHAIEVVRDDEEGSHEGVVENASKSEKPVRVVES